jgi:hypothetical protein
VPARQRSSGLPKVASYSAGSTHDAADGSVRSTLTLISGTSATVATGGNNSPVISADGGAVAWGGNSTALPPASHVNNNAHIFFRKGNGAISMVDTTAANHDCNGASNWPGLSADEKRQGFILPCVARPESDLVIEAPRARPAQ